MEDDGLSSLTHQLPTHLGVSQPLLRWGPLRLDVTALARVGVGCVVAARVWQQPGLPGGLRLGGVALVLVVALVLLVARPGDLPLEAWLLPLLVYALRPRLFVWRSRAPGHPWAVAGPAVNGEAARRYRLTAVQVCWGLPAERRHP
jgi:hypothetical protein